MFTKNNHGSATPRRGRREIIWSASRHFIAGFFVLALLGGARAQAQAESGTLAGVVVSTFGNGAPVSGVVITVRGTTLAAQTDATGRYELKNVPAGEHVLRFSKGGFATAVVTDVRVIAGQTTTVNGNMRPEFYDMEEFEVTAEVFTEQTEKIMFERQNSEKMVDTMGSAEFTKLGASDAGAIVTRVTGVTVVGGKYAVVRGLSDRYSRTLLNGVEVPSADPYRMSPQLDLFPAAMIDHISVSKTFTPDQPGGTGGGTIDIATKSFPEKPFIKGSYGNSYNPNSNLKKNFLADPDSSMDMFSLPSGPRRLDPELYGLTEEPPDPGNASSRETQERANLRRAQANARQDLMQSLGTANFAGTSKSSPLNTSFDASGGGTIPTLPEQSLGLFAGINYKRNFNLIEDAEIGRYGADSVSVKRRGLQTRGNINTDYGANANVGYALSTDHQLGFNFMLARSIDEEARHNRFDRVEGPEETLEQWQIRYTDREIFNYLINGHHEFPFLAKSKLDWTVGIANTSQDEPDNRFMSYYVTDGRAAFGDASLPPPQFPARYFREIEEDGFNYRVDWTLPLSFVPLIEEDSKLKAGFYSTSTERVFREQYFAYALADGFDLNNPNSYLNNPAYLRYVAGHLGNTPSGVGRTNYNWQRFINDTFAHPYTASLDITAAYVMGDIAPLSWLRFIGGVRLEKTEMNIDSDSGSSFIDQTDLLPSASAVITLYTNLNLRLGYGETIARPSFREKANVANFLPDEDVVAYGNPALTMVSIKSYDARLEWFPAPGDVISVGVFYKEIERPIELYSESVDDTVVTWINRSNGVAKVMGVEFEARKSMEFLASGLKGLSLGANVTLIESSTALSKDELDNKRDLDPRTPKTRSLYDQSPYIINLDMTYAHPTSGTTLAVGANLTGERIVIVKSLSKDIYEHPPISLDVSISQRFWKNWSARFSVRNVLDPDFVRTYGSSPDGSIYQSFKRGRTFALSLTAEF